MQVAELNIALTALETLLRHGPAILEALDRSPTPLPARRASMMGGGQTQQALRASTTLERAGSGGRRKGSIAAAASFERVRKNSISESTIMNDETLYRLSLLREQVCMPRKVFESRKSHIF